RAFLCYVQTSTNRWGGGSNASIAQASMSTLDTYWRTLQAIFSWFGREGVVGRDLNPLIKIPRPKVPTKVIQDIPLDLIVKALDEWDNTTLIGARNRAILLLLLDTGIRLSECAGINIADLNLRDGTARVWGKGGKQRTIPLSDTVKSVLGSYLLFLPGHEGPLWVDRNGKPIDKRGIQTMVRKLRKLGGNVRWSPHTFRNTFAVNFLRAGGDPFTTLFLLHSPPSLESTFLNFSHRGEEGNEVKARICYNFFCLGR
ncbi:MAG: tyrosine-type recombinase/integrase, partial [Dehalococcoidales bacterium]|nr:tyrosine-type recombinase/integrase [Dehalococcoidales bacterium]